MGTYATMRLGSRDHLVENIAIAMVIVVLFLIFFGYFILFESPVERANAGKTDVGDSRRARRRLSGRFHGVGRFAILFA